MRSELGSRSADRSWPRFGAVLLLAALAAGPAAAEKTDRILVSNRTEIIGEVKDLEHGRLRISTDYMGTVQTDWEQVLRIESRLSFKVETRDGEVYLGRLAPSDEDSILVVEGEADKVRIPFHQVLLVRQTKPGFLGNLDGSISLGFSFTKATDVTQTSFDATAQREAQKLSSRLRLVWISSDTEETSSSRQDLSYTIRRNLRKRWTYDASAVVQGNEELGLDRRFLVRGGALHRTVRTDIRELWLGTGLAASREVFTGEEPSETILEATLSLQYFAFHFRDPVLQVDVSIDAFPSLTTGGRFRSEIRADIRRELIRDLFWAFTGYWSFNNQPTGADASREDLSLTASLGWKF